MRSQESARGNGVCGCSVLKPAPGDQRDDENFMKTTIAEYSDESPILSYESVDVGLVEPRKRDYSKGKTKSAPTPVEGFELKPPNTDRQSIVNVEDAKINEGK